MRERIDRRKYPDPAKLELAKQMRRDPTPAERFAWSLLRKRGVLGLRFRRQHILNGFIVDFYCPQLRLVLELDGPGHRDAGQSDYDVARSVRLRAGGYRVLRIADDEVSRDRLERLLRPFASVDPTPDVGSPPLPIGRGGRGRGTSRERGRGRGTSV